ncbi:hypothetical protein [Nonomuraea sp. NPDC050786]|uniref:hypothetical protein n=1 Tax=Nonomuraea sp. NPDC050786 TaxID=3154840 RepID=UPI0033FD2CBE
MNRLIPALIALLLTMDLVGAVLSMKYGLSPTFLDALGSEARLSAPLPMMIAQVVLAFGATRRHRGVAAVCAGLLTIAGALAFISGFFDGGYGDARLTTALRLFQIALVGGHVAMGIAGGVRVAQVLRPRPALAGTTGPTP